MQCSRPFGKLSLLVRRFTHLEIIMPVEFLLYHLLAFVKFLTIWVAVIGIPFLVAFGITAAFVRVCS